MTITDKINELQKQATDIQKQIDALKKEAEQEWPKVGNVYFAVGAAGITDALEWDGVNFDKNIKLQGNIFRTRADAEKKRDQNALIAELRKEAGYYQPAIDGETHNYYLLWTISQGWRWEAWTSTDCSPRSGYFKSEIPGLIERYGDRLDLLRWTV